jgi:hypothetical protein
MRKALLTDLRVMVCGLLIKNILRARTPATPLFAPPPVAPFLAKRQTVIVAGGSSLVALPSLI